MSSRQVPAIWILTGVLGFSAAMALASANSTDPSGRIEQVPPVPIAERIDLPQEPRGPDPTYRVISPPSKSADRAVMAEQIRELLEAGWVAKPSGLKSIEEKYQAGKQRWPDDPRTDYDYGLVLLRHNKYDDAMKHFEAGGKNSKPPYLPAWRAAIWLRVLRRGYEPAATDLVSLTHAWQSFEPGPLPDWLQNEFVMWTGLVMGFLEGPADSSTLAPLTKRCSANIRSLLTKDQIELFRVAREEVLDGYAARADAQEKLRMEAKRKQEKEAEDAKVQLTGERDQTKQERKRIEKNADELEKGLKEQLAGIDPQLTSLSRDYDLLDSQARNLDSTIRALDQEIALLIIQRNQLFSERGVPPSSGSGKSDPTRTTLGANSAQTGEIQLAIDLRSRERLRYQNEYDRILLQLRNVQRQGAALMTTRQNLTNEYQKATGRLYKEDEALLARQKFLERRHQAISKPATGSTTQVKLLGQTAKALKTYVDFNLELEKQQLLGSFEAQ